MRRVERHVEIDGVSIASVRNVAASGGHRAIGHGHGFECGHVFTLHGGTKSCHSKDVVARIQTRPAVQDPFERRAACVRIGVNCAVESACAVQSGPQPDEICAGDWKRRQAEWNRRQRRRRWWAWRWCAHGLHANAVCFVSPYHTVVSIYSLNLSGPHRQHHFKQIAIYGL